MGRLLILIWAFVIAAIAAVRAGITAVIAVRAAAGIGLAGSLIRLGRLASSGLGVGFKLEKCRHRMISQFYCLRLVNNLITKLFAKLQVVIAIVKLACVISFRRLATIIANSTFAITTITTTVY